MNALGVLVLIGLGLATYEFFFGTILAGAIGLLIATCAIGFGEVISAIHALAPVELGPTLAELATQDEVATPAEFRTKPKPLGVGIL